MTLKLLGAIYETDHYLLAFWIRIADFFFYFKMSI